MSAAAGARVSPRGPRELGASVDVACEGCITCGDAAPPMTVVAVDRDRAIALCEDERGARASVEIALVEPVAPGDVLLVHAGTAIAHAATETAR